jgi:myo-inositol-1(or 4)-monophosphatase
VACGELDGYIHIGLNPWDFAAGQILVEEAGGRTSCMDGSPLKLFGPKKGVVASNGPVHDGLLATLRLA